MVLLPAGTYLAAGSIHMLSNVTLRLAAHSTLLGARSGYDDPEPNPYEAYSDPGHAHFHDALIWGENVHNIAFLGAGTIDGGEGNLLTAAPIPGRADKLISLARCSDLTISGLTLRRGGHFALLTNDCNHITSDNLTIDSAEARDGRDGWDVINARDVTIKNITIHSWDDALAFKSDWALGVTLPNGNVTVTGARLSSVCCNALMFGSETCGNFTGYRFSNIAITGAGKSGLGMVSMDGARISDVSYTDVAMSDVAGAIMEKIGTRRRCGDHPGVGSISDIRYRNVTAAEPRHLHGHPVGPAGSLDQRRLVHERPPAPRRRPRARLVGSPEPGIGSLRSREHRHQAGLRPLHARRAGHLRWPTAP